MKPQQRTAIITDAESCLGKALVRTLLDEHYNVIGIFSSEENKQNFLQELDNKTAFLPVTGESHCIDFAGQLIQQGIINFSAKLMKRRRRMISCI